MTAFLKDIIVARLTDLMGTIGVQSPGPLPRDTSELAAATRAKVSEEFAEVRS